MDVVDDHDHRFAFCRQPIGERLECRVRCPELLVHRRKRIRATRPAQAAAQAGGKAIRTVVARVEARFDRGDPQLIAKLGRKRRFTAAAPGPNEADSGIGQTRRQSRSFDVVVGQSSSPGPPSRAAQLATFPIDHAVSIAWVRERAPSFS